MEATCRVTSVHPLRYSLDPDQPLFEECAFTLDYTDALLADLGPSLLLIYASYAGPPITRDALAQLAQSSVAVAVERATRDEVLQRVLDEYPAVLARGRERVAELG